MKIIKQLILHTHAEVLKLKVADVFRISSFLHIIISIWIAHHLYYAISIHKFYLVIYLFLSVQFMLSYIRINYWKDFSMLALSVILFFTVFLIKYNQQNKITLHKDIYNHQLILKEKNANMEKHQVIYTSF